jgi:two-component system LytT family response regulator
VTIRTLLADDEPLARERLRTLIAAESDLELVAECRDGADAVEAIERLEPDLLFLDIQMPELDGFDVLQALSTSVPATVFVTAYDAYALRAFEVAAVDYLLKPIDEARFTAAVERTRVKLRAGGKEPDAGVAALIERLRVDVRDPQRFVVRSGSRVSLVRAEDVEWIEATGNYARIFAAGRAHLVRETMKSIETRLDPARFVRIHRSVIVQVDHIAVMEPYFHGEWVVKMRDGTTFTSSRTHSDRLRALMR